MLNPFLSLSLKAILISLFTYIAPIQTSWAAEIPASQYPFPLKDPYIASLLVGFSQSSLDWNEVKININSNRKKIPYLDQDNNITLQYVTRSSSAPTVMIISGLGGSSKSGLTLTLGEMFYKKGYNVITLPNNFSWEYTTKVSQKLVPGYMPVDSIEYYEFLKVALAQLKKSNMIQTQNLNLIGYSNGGLLAGFLSALDQKSSSPLFKKIILLNPAIDIEFGLNTLDSLYAQNSKISPMRQDYIKGAIYTEIENVGNYKNEVEFISSFISRFKIKPYELQWFIGDTFRQSLSNVILGSQLIENFGILKAKPKKYELNDFTYETRTFSFQDYMKKFVIPRLKLNGTTSEILAKSNLYSQMSSIQKDSRVYLLTNLNDFIINEKDLNAIRTNIPDNRFILFPLGGHLGNAATPTHIEMMIKILNTPAI